MNIPGPVPPDPFDKLRDPEFVKEQIDYFESRTWNVEDVEELQTEFYNRIGTVNLDPIVIKRGSFVFRGRPNFNQGIDGLVERKNLFDNVSQLGLNSRENTKIFGRAHFPGKPAFYVSPERSTVIHEIAQWEKAGVKAEELTRRLYDLQMGNVQPGVGPGQGFDGIDIDKVLTDDFNVITVSKWEVQEDLKLAYFFDKQLLSADIRGGILEQEFNGIQYAKPYKVRKSMELIRQFFAKQFTKRIIIRNADYMLSALCADLMYRSAGYFDGRLIGVDGVAYSSVAEGFKGFNYALSEQAYARGKVKFVSAELHGMIPKRSGQKSFHNIFSNAICSSEATGELVWDTPEEIFASAEGNSLSR